MAVVGLVVFTSVPARRIVTIAQIASARPAAKIAPPVNTGGIDAGTNGSGYSRSRAKPRTNAIRSAIGGRMIVRPVELVSHAPLLVDAQRLEFVAPRIR